MALRWNSLFAIWNSSFEAWNSTRITWNGEITKTWYTKE